MRRPLSLPQPHPVPHLAPRLVPVQAPRPTAGAARAAADTRAQARLGPHHIPHQRPLPRRPTQGRGQATCAVLPPLLARHARAAQPRRRGEGRRLARSPEARTAAPSAAPRRRRRSPRRPAPRPDPRGRCRRQHPPRRWAALPGGRCCRGKPAPRAATAARASPPAGRCRCPLRPRRRPCRGRVRARRRRRAPSCAVRPRLHDAARFGVAVVSVAEVIRVVSAAEPRGKLYASRLQDGLGQCHTTLAPDMATSFRDGSTCSRGRQ